MQLQQARRGSRRLAIALEPPGNLSRELSLYRRRLFRELGEPSALSFPDLAFLTWGLPPEKPPASPGSPGRLRRALDSCWTGVDGAFVSLGLVVRARAVFLGIGGPLSVLTENAAAAAASLGLASDPEPALESGLGFFALRYPESRASIEGERPFEPPSLSFLDCSLALIRLDLGVDPLSAASWRVLALSRRRTGP